MENISDRKSKVTPENEARPKRKVKARLTSPGFACINRGILYQPESGLTAFEMAIAATLLMLARQSLATDRHRAALNAGAEAIMRERKLANDFKNQWKIVNTQRSKGLDTKAPQRSHAFGVAPAENAQGERYRSYKPQSKTIQIAGRKGYKKGRAKETKNVLPEVIPVCISARRLLGLANQATGGSDIGRLKQALDKLSRPVGDLPPLIEEWEDSNGLKVLVSTSWSQKPFARVPMPLPTRSLIAQRLYLLLHTLDTGSPFKAMSFATLCDRIGVGKRSGSRRAGDTVNRALETVNEHLSRLEVGHLRLKDVAQSFTASPRENDRAVLFRKVSRPYRDPTDPALGEPEIPHPMSTTSEPPAKPHKKRVMAKQTEPAGPEPLPIYYHTTPIEEKYAKRRRQ